MQTETDPAIVNVPLAKRGNIDAQIDAWKAKQRAETAAATRSGRAYERALNSRLDALPDTAFASLAAKMGQTIKQTRKAVKRCRSEHIERFLAEH